MESSLSLLLLLLLITIIPYNVNMVNGDETPDDNTMPRCNATCRYVDWAYDANCRFRDLVSIPAECQQAKMLDLRNNRIGEIVENAFASFSNLLYLDLEDNGITRLDASAFVGNDRVKHIYLQSNALELIQSGTFAGVPNLLQLYLNSNRIRNIEPGAFRRLDRLETLFLNENVMEDITPGLLTGLDRLKYFHMTHNLLTELRNDTFKDLSTLRHLNLINNNIRVIEADAFKGLMSLRVLRLAYNEIVAISQGAFFRMRHLTQLDLYSNKIHTLSNFTTGLSNIYGLYLGDNPLQCDCHLEVLLLWSKMYHYVTDSKANATCYYPGDVKSHFILNMISFPPCPTPTPPALSTHDNGKFAQSHQGNGQLKSYDQATHVQYAPIHSSTIAVIAISCSVLFLVCFIGLMCFVYNAYIRTPTIPYNSASKECISKKHIHVTDNPYPNN